MKEEGGQLTEAIRRSPHSVVLLDEVEKAHGDVLNILLQIMEDGVLTDGKGRTVSFKNAILVMTSNIGSKRILQEMSSKPTTMARVNAVDGTNAVNGAHDVKGETTTMQPMQPETVLQRLQNNPKAMSLMMEAASNPSVMRAMQAAMGGSPADLLKAGRENPEVASFLERLWRVLDGDDVVAGVASPGSGLMSIRANVQETVSQWTDKEDAAASKLASGLIETMEDMADYSGINGSTVSRKSIENDSQYEKLIQVVKEELEATLKPELLNRIDEIVVFSPLYSDDLFSIANIMLQETSKRAEVERNIKVDILPNLVLKVMEEGSANAAQFGARPMRRAAQRFLEDSMSDAIIRGFLQEGDSASVDLSSKLSMNGRFLVRFIRLRDSATLEVEVEEASGGIGSAKSATASEFENEASPLR